MTWGEGEGFAGTPDAVDGGLGGKTQLLMAEHLVVVGVEGDAIVLLMLVANDLGCDVFECEEKLSVAGEEERDIGAGKFDADLGVGRGFAGAGAPHRQGRRSRVALGRCRRGC